MNTAGQFGIGIVGCGYWGINYVRVFNELPGARVAAVCDARRERLEEVGRRFPDVHLTTDLEELLSRENLDAVVVCTEATKHYGVALRCLAAGKHLLIEKPLTVHLGEAEELTLRAEQSGLTLMVGHTFLYNAAVRKIKDYLQQNPGEVYYLCARRTNLGPVRRDVNALWDLATHDIVIFNYLLDCTPEWVSAVGARVLRNCREDVGFISLGYPGGVLGHIHVSWADPGKAREVEVVCSDKRIVFDDLNGLEQVRIFEKGIRPVPAETVGYGEYRLQIRDGDIISPKIEISEPLKNLCRHFLECMATGRQPLSSGWNGIEVLRVLSAADQSMELQGKRVEIDHVSDHRIQVASASR